ncbi:hypothetical protein [Paenibacillus sp. DMB20]|uniref:hypothetical protein n=1 Tax=Paenibacillus sp. DMB20 TaxID=1642570 RepID=UPI000627A994|nr:hypothetical protein [Paenibacillus sp. DMB20]KKO54591.1 hypothetical protein XI25_05865 [Paenibacillus sp. DMB20]
MKLTRGFSWLWIGLAALVVLWLGVTAAGIIGQHGHGEAARVFGRGQGFGHRVQYRFEPRHAFGIFGMASVFLLMIKITLLALFALIWAKASGLLKWGGAGLAGLVLMSLLTPFWGLLAMILLFLAMNRMKRLSRGDGKYPESAGVYPAHEAGTPSLAAYERGRLLDEWEKSKLKEERP